MSKPFIFPDTKNDIEKFHEAAAEAAAGVFDSSYIPGYSEIVKANEIHAADDYEFHQAHRNAVSGARSKEDWYRIIGARPQPLEVYFNWFRVASVNGTNSYTADLEVANHTRRGWRLAKLEDDLLRRGYGKPPAAQIDASGAIRRLDMALFVIDAALEDRYQRLLRSEPDDEAPKVGETTQVPIEVTDSVRGEFRLATTD